MAEASPPPSLSLSLRLVVSPADFQTIEVNYGETMPLDGTFPGHEAPGVLRKNVIAGLRTAYDEALKEFFKELQEAAVSRETKAWRRR